MDVHHTLRLDVAAGTDHAPQPGAVDPAKPRIRALPGAPLTRRIAILGGAAAHVCDRIKFARTATRRVAIVGSAHSLDELDKAGFHVDAVILDLHLEDGRRATSAISAAASRHPVLIVAASSRRDDLLAAVQAGASGYLTTYASGDAIIEAVETIATGRIYLSSWVAGVTDAGPQLAEPAGMLATLSDREREALCYISEGLTQAQTANRMGVSPTTIDTYVKRIRRKLGPGNKADLTRQAIGLGCVNASRVGRCCAAVEGQIAT
jgi:two-component system, NarL family, nitrate/nitrite response regulator NarL